MVNRFFVGGLTLIIFPNLIWFLMLWTIFQQEGFSAFFFSNQRNDTTSLNRHVNRLCLAADVPLIESGSTGYLGQCQVIVKGETECYECQVKFLVEFLSNFSSLFSHSPNHPL